jgi:hypothetical protein
MATPADRPLLKVTLNLYEEDVAWMKQRWGWGWSTELRAMVHDYIEKVEAKKYGVVYNERYD